MRRRAVRAVVVSAVLAVLGAACTNPDIAGNTWICTTDADCAAGWRCAAGVCVEGDPSEDGGRPSGADAEGRRDTAGAGGADAGHGPGDVRPGKPDAAAAGDGGGGDGSADAAGGGEPDVAGSGGPDVAADGGPDVRFDAGPDAGGDPPCACDDGDPCTRDGCGPTGACQHEAEDCDDRDPCTVDVCDPRDGCRHEPADCDDGDPCTDDGCAAPDGCWHAPAADGAPCGPDGAGGRCREGDCCQPACGARICGDDGCGGSCGACGDGAACDGGACVAVPDCGDGVCAPDEGESCRTCRADCPTQGAAAEACDGVDNDCDGQTDEALDDPLAAGCHMAGVCTAGVAAPCAGGRWSCDYAAVDGCEPEETACDGRDNDCDGVTDEAVPAAAGCAALGVCAAGGVRAACDGSARRCVYDDVAGWEPVETRCDGADNDCDGATDEDLRAADDDGCLRAGVCAAGGAARVCEGGGWRCDYGAIDGWEPDETRCDARDNDCDGQTDEALTEATAPTDCRAAGVCAAGVPADCGAGGAWECRYAEVAGHEAAEASCDSRDNDCDGETDEDVCAYAGEPCATDADCAAGPCRLDVDGSGRFCAATAGHCVLALTAAVATQAPDGYVHCISGSVHHRRCVAGVWSAAATCADGDPCTADECRAGAGCAAPPAAAMTACDDGDPCTVADHCQDGACVSGGAAPCDDGVDCTADTCTPAAGCRHTAQDAACDDGLACTTDTCDAAAGCRHEPQPGSCDDGVPCTDDACLPGAGCTHTPRDAACDDGVPCTTDRCDPLLGCGAVPDDASCDDGVPCTADACDPLLGCRATPADAACDDGYECTRDTCDPLAGCRNVTDFALCDDGIPCTMEWCYLGRTCRHETENGRCDDGVACTTDRCDAVLGCVSEPDDDLCPDSGCGYAACDPQSGCTSDAARCDCVALRFAGHERVSAPDSAALSGGTNASRTFELWLRLDAPEERGWGAPILSKVNGETSGDWALTAWGDDLVFRYFRTGATAPETFVAADVLPTGAWTHVAVVVDRGARRVRLLVDGAEVLAQPASYDLANSTAPLYVGATPKLWPGRFEGALDEVRVWTVARTTAAIAADHARPLAGTETGLAAYWPFADAVDRTRRDTLGLRGGALTFAVGAEAPAAAESVLGAPGCPLADLPPLLISKYWFFEDQPYTGAYLEVANPGPEPVALGGYALELSSAGLGTRRVALTDVWLPSGGAWAVLALDGEPQRSVTPDGEGSALIQQQEILPLGLGDALVLVDASGAVVDSFGSRVTPTPWIPDPDGDGSYFAARACDDRGTDRDTDDAFTLGPRWITAREALPDPLPGRWCGRCGQVICPDGEAFDGACTRTGYCLRHPENAASYHWSHGYGMQVWIPPSEQAENQVRFVEGYFIDAGEADTQAVRDFLNDQSANACASGGTSYPCIDTGAALRTVDWSGSAASARWTCQSEPGGPADWTCDGVPAAGVTWSGAAAFCAWLGQRLCSDSEWQRAATGPTARTYPWGDAPSPATGAHANCRESACADGWSGPAPTQDMWPGVSACGAYHMGGNVWEWVADDWHAEPADNPPDGSAWLAQPPTGIKTLRGGGYESSAAGVGTGARAGEPVVPTSGRPAGVRCCGDGP